MLEWIGLSNSFALWMLIASAVMFAGALILVPVLVARIPEDYFAHPRRARLGFARIHPAFRWILIVIKNILGLSCLFFGALRLVLPGQGILTLLLGFSLLDYPGKFRMERWLVRRKGVLDSINWIREKADRPPLRVGP
jgi:hypothetical protein